MTQRSMDFFAFLPRIGKTAALIGGTALVTAFLLGESRPANSHAPCGGTGYAAPQVYGPAGVRGKARRVSRRTSRRVSRRN